MLRSHACHAMLSLALMLTRAACDEIEFSIVGFEAEYLSLVPPEAPTKPIPGWRSPPVIDANLFGRV